MPKTKKIYDIFPPEKGNGPVVNLQQAQKRLKKAEKAKKKSRGAIDKSSMPQKTKKKSGFKFWLILIFAVLIGGGVFAYLYFGKAEIEVWPRTDFLNFEKTIIVDAKEEKLEEETEMPEEKTISGKIFEAERNGEKEFSATGEIDIERKARGTIRVYNNYQQAQILVQNTRFQPPLEKVMYFRTTKRIVVPSKGYVDVEVVADQPGPEYNIEPSTFSVPGLAGLAQYYSVYGKSFSPMTGGYIGKARKITKTDIESAKESLSQELFSELKNYIRERAPSGFILLEDSFSQEISEISSSAQGGEELDSFAVTARVKIKVFICPEESFKEIANNYFISQKTHNKELQKESLKIEYNVKDIDWGKERIEVRLKSSLKIYSLIDENNLKETIARKSETEARDFLMARPEIDRAEIKLWPFWVKKVPGNTERIDLKINLE